MLDAAAQFVDCPSAETLAILVVANQAIFEGHQSGQASSSGVDYSGDVVVGDASRPGLHDGVIEAVPAEGGEQPGGVVDRGFVHGCACEFRPARAEGDEVFDAADLGLEVFQRGETEDMDVAVNPHGCLHWSYHPPD